MGHLKLYQTEFYMERISLYVRTDTRNYDGTRVLRVAQGWKEYDAEAYPRRADRSLYDWESVEDSERKRRGIYTISIKQKNGYTE